MVVWPMHAGEEEPRKDQERASWNAGEGENARGMGVGQNGTPSPSWNEKAEALDARCLVAAAALSQCWEQGVLLVEGC